MELFDPRSLALQLCEQWQKSPLLKGHFQPTPEQLAQVLEAAYLASMETDEGRTLKFGIILRASTEVDEPLHGIARFAETRPLNVNEIRRLAPATGLSSTFMAVELTEHQPRIWGTVDAGSEWARLQRAEQTSGTGLPFHLVVTVSAPGTINVMFSDNLLFSAERGQPARRICNVFKFGPVHEFFRPAMCQLLREAGKEDLISDPAAFLWNGGEYLRFLARTLKYADDLAHGGTVVLLRETDEDRVSDLITIKYRVTDFRPWNELVQYVKVVCDEIELSKLMDNEPHIARAAFVRWRAADREQKLLGQRLIDRSRFVARLTQVDGALVLTERLRVLGFGGVIRNVSDIEVADVASTVRSCNDELCRDAVGWDVRTFGTRHQSAIELCRRLDCLAFVLSQDGGVKAIKNAGDEVLVWPSVLLDPAAWSVTPEDLIPELREQYLSRRG